MQLPLVHNVQQQTNRKCGLKNGTCTSVSQLLVGYSNFSFFFRESSFVDYITDLNARKQLQHSYPTDLLSKCSEDLRLNL